MKDLFIEITLRNRECYVPSLVWIEFYYLTVREFGKEIAHIRLSSLKKTNIKEFSLNSEQYVRIGNIKVSHLFLSLVDATVIVAAQLLKGKIFTTDTPISKFKGIQTHKVEF
ncbi:MAG: hypothetical protein HeimC3_36050 [Candidatus Heimdallarchaeota archaeon LC_3]|nr:MAG: hypothetical protein HeimC3_36050 [Candidatus Heimdallarchaeota archaeon LC_3]